MGPVSPHRRRPDVAGDGRTSARLSGHLSRVRARLDALLAGWDPGAHLAVDPVSFVHRQARPDDQEVVGLVASSLAFGNVTAIGRSVTRVLDRLGPRPATAIARLDQRALSARLRGFSHRVYRGPDVAAMLAGAARVREQDGSLGESLARHLRETDGDLVESLARLVDRMRGPRASRGLRHLLPDPRAGSAVKRLNLWLRWMIRPADGVDLGLWPIPPSLLIVPLDTHVHRISRNLGLTARNDASLRTAQEITATLRRFDPDDPVKYDFAICHFGVSRRCPSRRDPALCSECVLRPACLAWR